nr:MAG: hypothetical protein [Microvirus sp.]
MRRKKMNGKASRKLFSKTASMSHKRNANRGNPMRGGIRL